jgi:hypothetical protein
MAQKFKRPGPHLGKMLRTDNYKPEPTSDLSPAFSFEKMQDKSGHSVECCEDKDRVHVLKRLFMLGKMSWRQILQAPRTGLGAEKIARTAINPPIPTSVTDDVDYFYALHYQGNKRMIGYKPKGIFYVLWIDHNFTVYNHG